MDVKFRLVEYTIVRIKFIIKNEVVIFLSFGKNKETKCISLEMSKGFKRAVVFMSKLLRSKIFVT